MPVLIHTTDGHFKFWSWDIGISSNKGDRAVAIFRWGRIGTEGQVREKAFRSEAQANSYVMEKAQEKYGKGYVRYPHDIRRLLADARSGKIDRGWKTSLSEDLHRIPRQNLATRSTETMEQEEDDAEVERAEMADADEGVYDDGDGNAVDIGGNPIPDVFPESMRRALDSYRKLANERRRRVRNNGTISPAEAFRARLADVTRRRQEAEEQQRRREETNRNRRVFADLGLGRSAREARIARIANAIQAQKESVKEKIQKKKSAPAESKPAESKVIPGRPLRKIDL